MTSDKWECDSCDCKDGPCVIWPDGYMGIPFACPFGGSANWEFIDGSEQGEEQ